MTTKKTAQKAAQTKSATKKQAATKSTPAKSAAKNATTKRAGGAKASKKVAASRKGNYTKPDLRERIKDEVMAADKGGRPGQWSARKAQLVAHEYEAQGGGYQGARTESQQHLEHWGEEKWHTADGKPAIQGKTTHRYLPDEAWKKLSPEQKKATDEKKVKGSRSGKQFVPNTATAKQARRKATAKNATAASKKAAGTKSPKKQSSRSKA